MKSNLGFILFIFKETARGLFFRPKVSFLTTRLVQEDKRFVSRWTSAAKYFSFCREVDLSLGVKGHTCFSETCHAIKQIRVKQELL